MKGKMRGLDRESQLMAGILQRFSEAELRGALQRELPELLTELPGPGAPFRDVAFMLVQAARRSGYLPDLEILVASRRRRSIGSLAVIVGVLVLLGAGATSVANWAVPERPWASEAIREGAAPAAAPVETPPTSPVATPEARSAAEPLMADSRPHAARRKEGLHERKREVPILVSAGLEPASEPTAGRALCRGWSCRLGADGGQFYKSEEFCVVPAGGSEVKRCIIHGRLIHPAPTVECDLSESQLTGELRWQRCHGEN
ncbi:hypothetical protein [Nannocystis pusilla]|uniref:hypothetical protein n=1 Tax=Nannocystis pusilla TaxID=889268 RepID=UPI003DA2F9A7